MTEQQKTARQKVYDSPEGQRLRRLQALAVTLKAKHDRARLSIDQYASEVASCIDNGDDPMPAKRRQNDHEVELRLLADVAMKVDNAIRSIAVSLDKQAAAAVSREDGLLPPNEAHCPACGCTGVDHTDDPGVTCACGWSGDRSALVDSRRAGRTTVA